MRDRVVATCPSARRWVRSAETRDTRPRDSGVVRWLKAEKRSDRRLADMHLVDVLRRDPGLDDEAVGLGHDQHERLARRDDAADRVHGELVDEAVLRRADVDALELVLGRDLALDQFGRSWPRISRSSSPTSRAQILVDLQDLQLGLGDACPSPAAIVAIELAALALEPRRLALQRGQRVSGTRFCS